MTLIALSLATYAWASGGGGDYRPVSQISVLYQCTTRDQAITVNLKYIGDESSSFNFQTVEILGFSESISFPTFSNLNIAEYYDDLLKNFPNSVFTSNFNFRYMQVYGSARYRSSNYQIEAYSKRNESGSLTLDIFSFDLIENTKTNYLKVPCSLTVFPK